MGSFRCGHSTGDDWESVARTCLLQLDTGTEQALRSALREQRSEQATLIVAHRMSSLMHADEILFLEGGRIVERGDHVTLMALGGRYADLYALQTRGDDATGGEQP